MKLKALIQKEFQRFFRDPKLIATLVLPGVLIYFIYSLLGSAIWGGVLPGVLIYFIYSLLGSAIWGGEKNYSYDVLVYGSSPKVEALFEGSFGESLTLTRTEDKENAKAQVKAGSVTALITFSEDFDNAVSEYDPMSGAPAPQVEIFYRSADDASAAFYTAATSLLSAYEGEISNAFDVNLGGEQYDFSSTSEVVMTILGGLLPFLVVTLIFSSCMSITLESVAGEKERGTLATILVTSVRRTDIALGKVLPLSCIAALGALSSFLGIALSMPKLMGLELGGMFVEYAFGDYILLLALIVSIVPLIVSAMTAISTYAKSVKEASSYTGVIMIVVMVLSLVSAFLSGIGDWVAVIPVLGTVVAIQRVLEGGAALLIGLIAIGINLVFTALFVLLVAKMLGSERIMFGK